MYTPGPRKHFVARLATSMVILAAGWMPLCPCAGCNGAAADAVDLDRSRRCAGPGQRKPLGVNHVARVTPRSRRVMLAESLDGELRQFE